MLRLKANPAIYHGYIQGMSLPVFSCELMTQGQYPEKVGALARELLTSNWQTIESDFHHQDVKIFSALFMSICKKLRVPTGQPIVENFNGNVVQVLIPYVYLKPTALIIQLTLNTLAKLDNLLIKKNDFLEQQKILINQLEVSYQKIRPLIDMSLNNYFILEAAIQSCIPHKPIAKSTWQLGYGANRRIFESTMTDQTPAWSVKTAKNKKLTADRLNSLGFPGAQHVMVQSEEQLLQAIQKIGFPLVIKPLDAEQGNGVSADLTSESDALIAFKGAQKFSKKILVEKHQVGFTHRLTLLNHRVIKVVKRVAGGVVGDGQHTIVELIELHQKSDDYQRKVERRGKSLLSLDDEAISLLMQNDLSPQSIPEPGQYIRLRRRDNINAGGRNESIALNEIHPDNIQLVIDISKNFHFDIVGIDLIIEDITQSWLLRGATVCEINAQPQLGASQDPELYPMLLKELLLEQGMIPVDLVIKSSSNAMPINVEDKTYTKSILTDQSGLYAGGKLISKTFPGDFLAARAGLSWSTAREVVCCVSYDELLKHGLPLYHAHIRHVYLDNQVLSSEDLVQRFHFSPNQLKSL